MASDLSALNYSRLEVELLRAIMVNGGPSHLTERGYQLPQISAALKSLVDKGVLKRENAKFTVQAQMVSLTRTLITKLPEIEAVRVEKLAKNASYQIGHQALEEITRRVRTQR